MTLPKFKENIFVLRKLRKVKEKKIVHEKKQRSQVATKGLWEEGAGAEV